MSSPWSSLDAATGSKNLYLNPSLIPAVSQAYEPYGQTLQTLMEDRLDYTTGYFGNSARNELAGLLEKAFASPGVALTDYLQKQRSTAQDFIKTAQDAAAAQTAADAG